MSDLPRGLSTVLVKHARLFAPDPPPEAVVDILMVGDRVAAIGLDLTTPAFAADPTELDAEGRIAIPGLIDQHVHIAGGGGEGGPQFRTPEIPGQDLTQAGITTVVGVLGTDGVTRSIQGLLAKARSLGPSISACTCTLGPTRCRRGPSRTPCGRT